MEDYGESEVAHKETTCENWRRVELPHDSTQWWALELTVLKLHVLTVCISTVALFLIMLCLVS